MGGLPGNLWLSCDVSHRSQICSPKFTFPSLLRMESELSNGLATQDKNANINLHKLGSFFTEFSAFAVCPLLCTSSTV